MACKERSCNERGYLYPQPRPSESLGFRIMQPCNKTKVISADLLDLDFDFEDIIMFGNISVLVTFQFS